MGQPMQLVAAAVQMTSGPEVEANLERAVALVRKAARRGAELVVLPENFALMTHDEEAKLGHAEALSAPSGAEPGPIVRALAAVARETGAWLVAGGMPERVEGDARRVYNTCAVFSPDGRMAGAYRKIHLFDIRAPDGITYHESKLVAPGERAVVVEAGWGKVGLSVCYDLRFPELYRELVRLGAGLVVVPAAFTLATGKDHWHVLLRARAIENQVFVVAAAQQGRHSEKRVTYGHSLIIDPWGTPLAEAPDGEGVIVAELDLGRMAEVRAALPCLQHRRL